MQRFLNLARITTIISEQTIQNIPRLASFGNLIEDGFFHYFLKKKDKISQTKICINITAKIALKFVGQSLTYYYNHANIRNQNSFMRGTHPLITF